MSRRSTLASLYKELETMGVFDRVHDLATDTDPADERAYVSRQIRRSQIIPEIQKLSAETARLSNAVALFCAVTLYYLFS